jgi:GDSL/SGNH-like Acyl-Esterase family found in Pmr5 and Cas1p
LDYNWAVSGHCVPLKGFNITRVCDLISDLKGSVAFIGDSVNREFFLSFTFPFYRAVKNHFDGYFKWRKENIPTPSTDTHVARPRHKLPCISGTTEIEVTERLGLYFYRNDRLSMVNETHINYQDNFMEDAWFQQMGKIHAKLLVMNRGAHFENTTTVLEQLNITFSSLFETHPNISVVWRTTVPGHAITEEDFFAKPLDHYKHVAVRYNWEKFYDQNDAVIAFLNHHFPQVLVLDVCASASLRKDSHQKGGLHYCLPGPLDTWAILLYNALYIIDDTPTALSP